MSTVGSRLSIIELYCCVIFIRFCSSIRIDLSDHELRVAFMSNLSGAWSYDSENDTLFNFGKKITLHFRQNDEIISDQKICEAYANLTRPTGAFFFPCSCFPSAGIYTIRIGNDTQSTEISYDWPEITLSLPEKHYALTDAVSVQIGRKPRLCQPEKPLFNTKLEILHKRADFFEPLDPYRVLYHVSVADFWELDSNLILPCKFFDREGLFKVRLRTFSEENFKSHIPKTIAESNEMRSFWSDKYRLQMRTDGIFPCPDNGVSVSFTRPPCQVTGDRIRLYGIANQRGQTLVKPTKLFYLSEQKIIAGERRNVVSFPCNNFDLINLGYCFKYVSVLYDGLVKDNHTMQCVPTRTKNYELQDSVWSEWESWGSCSVSCGEGVQHRQRSCIQPDLRYRKAYCTGSGISTQICNPKDCENDTSSILSVINRNSACVCGCNLTKNEETIVAYSNLCETQPVTWSIAFEEEEIAGKVPVVQVLKLQLRDSDRLIIRDGLRASNALMFDSDSSLSDEIGLPIWGKTSVGIRVDFWSPKSGAAGLMTFESENQEEWHGAIISVKLKTPIVLPDRRLIFSGNPSFLQILIICGVSAGIILVLILLAVFFVWSTRKKLRENCRQLLAESYRTSDDGSSLEDQDCYASLRKKIAESPKKHFSSPKKDTVVTVRATLENIKENQPLLHGSQAHNKGFVANDKYASSGKRMDLINQGLCRLSQDMTESMHTSTTTASTRLSGISQKSETPPTLKPVFTPNIPPKCRSIGIQLNSPALPIRRSFGSKTSMSTMNHNGTMSSGSVPNNRSDSPSISLAGTEQDFEYDYYEPNVPGSFLNPQWFNGGGFGELLSEIDIDEIIGDSELMKTPTRTPPYEEKGKQESEIGVSVSTQFFAPIHPFRTDNLQLSYVTELKDSNKNLAKIHE